MKTIITTQLKTIKMRQVYAQSSNPYKIISQLQSFSIQTKATKLGVPADTDHSSLTNMGHK